MTQSILCLGVTASSTNPLSAPGFQDVIPVQVFDTRWHIKTTVFRQYINLATLSVSGIKPLNCMVPFLQLAFYALIIHLLFGSTWHDLVSFFPTTRCIATCNYLVTNPYSKSMCMSVPMFRRFWLQLLTGSFVIKSWTDCYNSQYNIFRYVTALCWSLTCLSSNRYPQSANKA